MLRIEYLEKVPVIVRGVFVTIEDGPEIAAWSGGRWHPNGVAARVKGARLHWPCISMPKEGAGLPYAYARNAEYEGDWIIVGVCGELYVSVPSVFDLAYRRPAERSSRQSVSG